ncbi:1,4-alpha-glucan branching enzyme (GH13/CBM48) [Formosa agariphila KMM 3901]|uniref:1,4-alpha-glucan branching enzyme GlgB n=1 Tax=Formosa agariphila (strain DSM 15362 / KCTC 12365 / LMG 23005 / KMM 3901 / M-2Alg 35-1) TaxID=1347342 RepID=T2KRY0_FORAG|nr:1,4-alpha-glucan branching protein GlgB [Formosa agariphila]CDF81276.1 1,4-alpha-glucan branching enzyme (GH13/CBM48) [Formosa agariphila KMM 3901]
MTKVKAYSLFTDFDINLFKSGKHYNLFEKFGSHIVTYEGEKGTYFAVWAPSAKSVSVIGDFNFWNAEEHPLYVRWDSSGIWEGFIPNVGKGTLYKYAIISNNHDIKTEKADPYAIRCEQPPKTASIVWETANYKWKDKGWMSYRNEKNGLDRPYAVYEVHLGSWMKNVEEDRFLTYSELSKTLVAYVKDMNFTHVEFMPIMEFPYDPSWGYQITGYFAPTSRFGTPQEFMGLIDAFHDADIGVILDWVPSHFPSDAHGLGNFDGSHLYEHPDVRKGYHQDWKSLIFNYERPEVRSFLISNAVYWLQNYHIDALRVDAVASMIYLDYSREEGEWEPNIYGGNENLAAVSFLKECNEAVYSMFNGIQTIAEESTAYTGVTNKVEHGGLGFGMKWMMGWMHDTLDYFKKDPIYRSYHQNEITFSLAYAFSEHFMLPISHDEVVYGKNSVLGRMPGDEWQRFANLRLMLGYMYTHPGTKLLFMGAEFGQYNEWDFQTSLDWNLLEFEPHIKTKSYVKTLNTLYQNTPALYEKGFAQAGFEWISYDDHQNAVMSYIRKGHDEENDLIVVCNFTPNSHKNYDIGVPRKGTLVEIFNSDSAEYGGSGVVNTKAIKAKKKTWNNKPYMFSITVPPLAISVFKYK